MKRGRISTVGTHPKIAQILADLGKEVSIRKISQKYGLSIYALYRYLRDLPKDVEKVRTAAEVERGERILSLVVLLQDKLLGVLKKAEKAGQDATSIAAIRACLDNLEFHAKLTGKVPSEAPTVNVQVNLLQSPEWLKIQQCIVSTLGPFPKAKAVVVKALAGLRSDDARHD